MPFSFDPALIVSVIALGISVMALWRSWKVHKLQANQLAAQLAASRQAEVRISLRRRTNGRGADFVVQNFGQAEARDVSFEINPRGNGDSPLVPQDYNSKFPVERMQPGQRIEVLAFPSFDSAPVLDAVCRWTDGKGEREEPCIITLER